jgi:hypothetical protein
LRRLIYGHHNLPKRITIHRRQYVLARPRWPQYRSLDRYPKIPPRPAPFRPSQRLVRRPKFRTIRDERKPSWKRIIPIIEWTGKPRRIIDWKRKATAREVAGRRGLNTLGNPILYRNFLKRKKEKIDPDIYDRIDWDAEVDRTLEPGEMGRIILEKHPNVKRDLDVDKTRREIQEEILQHEKVTADYQEYVKAEEKSAKNPKVEGASEPQSKREQLKARYNQLLEQARDPAKSYEERQRLGAEAKETFEEMLETSAHYKTIMAWREKSRREDAAREAAERNKPPSDIFKRGMREKAKEYRTFDW